MYFLKKTSIKSKNSDRSVWIIIYQAEVELIAQSCLQIHASKLQFSPLFLISSTLFFTPAEILSH